jgi:hypothetical protein
LAGKKGRREEERGGRLGGRRRGRGFEDRSEVRMWGATPTRGCGWWCVRRKVGRFEAMDGNGV